MLYFKITGKTKYAFYSLLTLAQVHYLLPPSLAYDLVWNRFINNKGKVDTNVEVDRTVEHKNKDFKMDCKDFQGKLTSSSIKRASESFDAISRLVHNFDYLTSTRVPSGKHTRPDMSKDITDLANQFVEHDIFSFKPAREHRAFPSFPQSILQKLDTETLRDWMTSRTEDFQQLKVYQEIRLEHDP
eukprot:Seg5310.2 transcript_id=Seg5310.2/GoldUCD/mRNA.D3Y31 product="hypothetical protein" protein_id=Seg5310.2/GoldUCD/D3Y31